MRVKWWGHACFELRDDLTIIFDPHDGRGVGLSPPKTKADIILASHRHFDHADGVDLVRKKDSEVLVERPGEHQLKGVRVRGVSSFHDESSGRLRGKNVIYVVEVGDLRFCHLGDLGHVPTGEQIREIGSVDVLFVPVGGVYTIDAGGATETVEKIKPKIAVPMHYMIEGLTVGIAGVEGFLKGKKNVRRLEKSEFEVDRKTLPKSPEIWVLTYEKS